MTPVLKFESARERASAKSRRKGSEWKKNASSAETSLTVKRTPAKAQKLKHGTFADFVSQSRRVEYKSGWYRGSLAVSVAFKRNSRLTSS